MTVRLDDVEIALKKIINKNELWAVNLKGKTNTAFALNYHICRWAFPDYKKRCAYSIASRMQDPLL